MVQVLWYYMDVQILSKTKTKGVTTLTLLWGNDGFLVFTNPSDQHAFSTYLTVPLNRILQVEMPYS